MNKLFFHLSNFVVFLLSLFLIFPFFSSFDISSYIFLLLELLWVCFSFFSNKEFYLKIPKHRFLIYIYILYTILIPIIFGNLVITNRYINLSLIFIYFLIYEFGKYQDNNKSNIKILKIIFVMSLIPTIKTFSALLTNNYVSRSIKSSGELSLALKRQNIGGFELIYFFQMVIVLLINILFFTKMNKKYKILLGIYTLFLVYIIILSNYLTALLLILISSCLVFLFKIIWKKNLIVKLFVSILLIIFIINIKFISVCVIDKLITFTGESYNTTRLLEIKKSINGTSNFDGYDDRGARITDNIKQAISNPIFGIIINKIRTENGYLVGFGQHSFITDTYALYGLFVGTLLVYILFKSKELIKKNNSKYSLVVDICFINYILLLVLNNANPLMGMCFYFVLPITINYIERTEGIRHENN